jgi:hypothetical protein
MQYLHSMTNMSAYHHSMFLCVTYHCSVLVISVQLKSFQHSLSHDCLLMKAAKQQWWPYIIYQSSWNHWYWIGRWIFFSMFPLFSNSAGDYSSECAHLMWHCWRNCIIHHELSELWARKSKEWNQETETVGITLYHLVSSVSHLCPLHDLRMRVEHWILYCSIEYWHTRIQNKKKYNVVIFLWLICWYYYPAGCCCW